MHKNERQVQSFSGSDNYMFKTVLMIPSKLLFIDFQMFFSMLVLMLVLLITTMLDLRLISTLLLIFL